MIFPMPNFSVKALQQLYKMRESFLKTSLTIISDLSVDGEIWTTRLFGKTTEEIIDTLNQLSNIEGVVINDKGEVFYSCGMNELIL